ncbi:serine hydrolase domain-containing protein [Pontixanthobacter aquaemixtae]|uniref:serine hydrolase domain-containing protein n=1 Tax=Pontixanthobacter aquaemixtae TaxID=1958940 RepID=UPI0019281F5A|nr:serine hydrolase domain-containing protein [Pontixanthobacter aquaemixtae]
MIGLVFAFAVQANVPRGTIESFIDREMPASGTPGLAYAVVQAGADKKAGARGVKRAGGEAAITPDTPFITGSISKSFTALAVMQLVEAGKIDLDAEISQYLAEFSGQPAGTITIRQLLSHTSGFSTYQGNVSHTEGSQGGEVFAQQAAAIATLTPAYAPGTRWEYSNQNYKILGRLIEVVSGQSFIGYITGNILEPVGMRNSFVSDGKDHAEMATGHRPWFGSKRPLARNSTHLATAPQGGIVASASDLALYMQTMMNGEDDILSAEGKAAMMSPASDISPNYGFGWFLDPDDGTVFHSGASPGFETLLTMVPAEQKGAAVLVNAGSGIGFGESIELRNGITARAIGLDYNGEGSRFWQKAMFVGLALLPVLYLVSMVWAWRHRAQLRAKSGASGLFSLWFPLLTTIGAAVFLLVFVPQIFAASLPTIGLFQPDTGLAIVAAAALGVLWAIFRLGVVYTKPAK